jgi:hypothetical protein
VLAIKIVLIAMLLPLHHSLEHKVFHYLTSKAHRLKEKLHFFHHAPVTGTVLPEGTDEQV